MHTEKKVGIVTVTYNSGKVLTPFLDCLFRQTHSNFIVYIIDNLSSDDSVALVEAQSDPRIRLMANTVNTGVAAGNNQGILAAMREDCELIWLVNNDVEFEDACLSKLVTQLYAREVSMVTHKMMYYFDRSLIWYAGSDFIPRAGNMAHHRGMREKDEGQYDVAGPTQYAPTCSILFRRSVFEDIGLMDEQYFAYFDDTDFLLRAFQDGRHVLWYYPDVVFYHKIGQSSQSKKGGISKFIFGDFHIRLTTRNKVYYLRKQRNFIAWVNIFYFYFRLNLRFLFSGKYTVNADTWQLIQRSFLEGLRMELPKGQYTLLYNQEDPVR